MRKAEFDQPFLDALPALGQEIINAARAKGRSDIADQLSSVQLSSVTYDVSVDAGYLYLSPSRPLNIAEQTVIGVKHGDSIVLDSLPGTVVIDVDNFGRVQGVELLGYRQLFQRLGLVE